jgi:hypothetical protein
MASSAENVPDWDLEQIEVILDDPTSWQLVVAGPGTGKSAVACQRVAFLVDEGVPPSRILLVSFTRTAVAELRSRIVSYSTARDLARSVRISTIDSHAWSLRVGFDDEPLPRTFGDDSYELNIERVVEIFRSRQPELVDFMHSLEHLIVDEAQDVVGIRADLVIEMLRSVSDSCGVTILADPAQAIYGFTTEEEGVGTDGGVLLERLNSESPRSFTVRQLQKAHRIRNKQLVDVFESTRKEVNQPGNPIGHVDRMLAIIRETCSTNLGATSYENVAKFLEPLKNDSVLVLFRRRADVLLASSFCSQAGLQHRLRMSGSPLVIRPWLGWLLGEYQQPFLARDRFDELWDLRAALAPSVFEGEVREESWTLLHRVAAGQKPGNIDLVQLRRVLCRFRPPVDMCFPDLGNAGPILGTIHASKGREADTVLLVMPGTHQRSREADNPAIVFEEGRVYYVGATRARKVLIAAGNPAPAVDYLDSRRIYRRLDNLRVQLEVGREGDVDPVAHLSWTNATDVQRMLASHAGKSTPVKIESIPEHDYAPHLVLLYETPSGVKRDIQIGQMSEPFRYDLNRVWSIIDTDQNLRPAPTIQHVYLISVATIALSDTGCEAVSPPFNKSGFALAPIVKGFPLIQFLYRRRNRRYMR